jgi:SecD/SecF fusion protein
VKNARLVRALLALAILAVSAYYAFTQTPTLGLDLRGGTQIVLETQDTETVQADQTATDRATEVLRNRVDNLGVAEATLTRSGDNRIIVELPDVDDPTEAAEVIGRTAQLTFHEVQSVVGPRLSPAEQLTALRDAIKEAEGEEKAELREQLPEIRQAAEDAEGRDPEDQADLDAEADAEQNVYNSSDSGERLQLGESVMDGGDVSEAAATLDPQTALGWYITLDFKGGGGDTWADLTGQAACNPDGDPKRRVAIVLDNDVISSPQVDPSVQCNVGITGGTTQITGDFTQDQAKDLAALINGGALPVPVEVIEQRVVGPTLGQAAIDASVEAAIIGIILTAIFIMVVYRLMGFLATIALGCYALISYAALIAIGATLTLPGLAGFVLAIGMAVDANVLVFERAREEYAGDKNHKLNRSLTEGFRNALSAIADSNITTLIASGLLFFLASGPVRGFGVTLSIGVLASMISALLITRVLAEFAAERGIVVKRPKISGIAGISKLRQRLTDNEPDVMQHGRKFLAVSAVLIIVSFAGIALRGMDFGIEFTGGRLVEYSTTETIDVEEARSVVSDAGFPTAVVQESGDADISVRVNDLSNEQVTEIGTKLSEAGAGEVDVVRDELIGASLGDELRRNAFIALGVALLFQLAYLAFRFRWTFSAGAVAALFHNVVIVIGIFAWLNKPIDGIFLAAILTIIGYTVNDTVVVFDRVRETWGYQRKRPFRDVANTAVVQTLPRTINTGLSTLFILGALFVLGGDSLSDFALALLIGIVVGTYSSMLTATPLAIELEAKSSAPPPAPKRDPAAEKRKRQVRSDTSGAVV